MTGDHMTAILYFKSNNVFAIRLDEASGDATLDKMIAWLTEHEIAYIVYHPDQGDEALILIDDDQQANQFKLRWCSSEG